MHIVEQCCVDFVILVFFTYYILSIMSGDSPNALSTENVFDFKEGRSSPSPTTSKEPQSTSTTTGGNNVVTASVLVEPLQKDIKSKREDGNDEDTPDFQLQSPTMNQDANNTSKQMDDNKYDNGENKESNNKEELNLLNGLDRLPNTRSAIKSREDEDDEDNQCIVNCIYYTMECCKCSII